MWRIFPQYIARSILSNTECISKLFGIVRHCFSHSTEGSSKTRQITIRGLGLNTTNHDIRPIGLTTNKTVVPRTKRLSIFLFNVVQNDFWYLCSVICGGVQINPVNVFDNYMEYIVSTNSLQSKFKFAIIFDNCRVVVVFHFLLCRLPCDVARLMWHSYPHLPPSTPIYPHLPPSTPSTVFVDPLPHCFM